MNSFTHYDLRGGLPDVWPCGPGNECEQCGWRIYSDDGPVWAKRDRRRGTIVLHATCMIKMVSEMSTHTDEELEYERRRHLNVIARRMALDDHERTESVNILQEMIDEGVT